MLEPEIKYESCEEIYTGPPTEEEQTQTEVEEQNCIPNVSHKRRYAEHLQSVMPEIEALADSIDTSNYISNYANVQQAQLATTKPFLNPMKVKRRRYETTLLFQHPFFHLHEDWDRARTGETITAKCLSCKVTLRGHKNVSSNFIKHMKRLHPALYKIYENYKLLKFQGWNPLNPIAGSEAEQQTLYDQNVLLEQLANATPEDNNCTDTSQAPPADAPVAIDSKARSQTSADGKQNIVATANVVSDGGHSGVGNVRLVSQDKILANKQGRSEVDLSPATLKQMSQLLDTKLSGFVTLAQLEEERRSMLELIENKLEESLENSNEDDSSFLTNKTDTPSATQDANKATRKNSNNSNIPTITISDNDGDDSSPSSLQTQLDELKRECQHLRTAVQSARRSKLELRAELDSIDKTVRQRKMFVYNMPMQTGEQAKQIVERLLREYLQLPQVQVSSAYVISRHLNKSKVTLVFELQKAQDAEVVLKSCVNLKNTGIGVEQALGPHALKRKHKMIVLRREILRRKPNLKVMWRNGHLIIGETHFCWDSEDGLYLDGQVDDLPTTTTESSAIRKLKELTGLDMREFLNVLQNYNIG